ARVGRGGRRGDTGPRVGRAGRRRPHRPARRGHRPHLLVRRRPAGPARGARRRGRARRRGGEPPARRTSAAVAPPSMRSWLVRSSLRATTALSAVGCGDRGRGGRCALRPPTNRTTFFGVPNFASRTAGTGLRRAAAAACAAALALGACSAGTDAGTTPPDDGRPVVLTTFTVLADMAENVAGEHLRVESITKVGAEIHGYEPTPGDVRRATEADLVLDNGMGLEAWFARFVADLDVPHVVVSEGVDPIPLGQAHRPRRKQQGKQRDREHER